MTRKPVLVFEDLPLVEVVVRAALKGPRPLTYAIVNALAVELKQTFPTLEELKQYEVVPGVGRAQIEIGPAYLPGATYVGHKDGLSVSLQPQVIVARWVKHSGLPEPKYPRYPALRDSFWTAVNSFILASGDEYAGIDVVNMSYVNFIPVSDSASVLKDYFSDQAQLPGMDKARQVRKLEAAWTEDDELDLRFAIEQATARLGDSVKQGYQLTTAAGLKLKESRDAKVALERVHDALQVFFLSLISDRAKREWKFQEA